MPEEIVSFAIKVRLTPSHGMSRPGFSSAGKGVFVTPTTDSFHPSVQLTSINVLGIDLRYFSIAEPSGDWQTLKVDFEHPQSPDAVSQFLTEFANAFSASLAPRQRDPWYGNLFVDLNWSSLQLHLHGAENDINFSVSTHLSSTTNEIVSREILSSLTSSPFHQVFVEGMRASHPRAKYHHWFVILEELEKRP